VGVVRRVATLAVAIGMLLSTAACSSSSSNSSSSESFCDRVRAAVQQLQSLDFAKPDSFSPIATALDDLESQAPDELKADLEKVADGASNFAKGTIPDQGALLPAIQHLQQYAQTTCQVTLPSLSTESLSTGS
jgi:phage-related minor tail protein